MNVKIKAVYGELSFNMTQENALALISTAIKYSNEYTDGADPRNDALPALAYAAEAVAKMEKPTPKEPNAPPAEKSATKSRLESLFGAKSEWKMPAQPTAAPAPVKDTESGAKDEAEGYKGFLHLECEACKEVKSFCVKYPLAVYRCKCGHETELRDLLPAHVKCECERKYTYHTNLPVNSFTIDCMNCGSPVDMELGAKANAFVTVGDVGGNK